MYQTDYHLECGGDNAARKSGLYLLRYQKSTLAQKRDRSIASLRVENIEARYENELQENQNLSLAFQLRQEHLFETAVGHQVDVS